METFGILDFLKIMSMVVRRLRFIKSVVKKTTLSGGTSKNQQMLRPVTRNYSAEVS